MLETKARNDDSYEVVLRDAAGRLVEVTGLEARTGIGTLHVGEDVWFFELEPSDRRAQHGVFVHPRNFHATRPGRGWADALRLRAFRASIDPILRIGEQEEACSAPRRGGSW